MRQKHLSFSHSFIPFNSFILILILFFCSCGNTGNQAIKQSESDTVTDDYGRTVAVPTHPQRVVSLSPAVTEIMFALGAQEILVGRTDFCTYPPEAEAIPSIGGISNLNIESILALNPDLVISGSMVGKKVTDQMDAMGVPMVCVIEKPKFEALYDNIATIGELVGKERKANKLIENLKIEINLLKHFDSVKSQDPHSTIPTCYYVVGFGAGGNFTAGGNTFINDIIRMAGGRNIAEGIEGWSYSLEALMKEDPDFIIVRREDSAAFCDMKPYNRLSAVKNGHVIGIVSGTLDLQVPRNIDAVIYLRSRFGKTTIPPPPLQGSEE